MRDVIRDRIGNNLVFFTGNVAAESPNQICTCCDCCCHMLGQIIHVNPGMIVTPPRYRAVVDENACTDCGKCLGVCNLMAHRMEGRRHAYDPYRCVGCGLCVAVCPSIAIEMVENEAYRPPAGNFKRLMVRLAPAKLAAMAKGKFLKKRPGIPGIGGQ
ncbi:MAG: 4Fe-4S dicluster domain-containing protein [Chrysiogenales bacterium]|nr:MAG: 4Fe-4S dicluster domain-containing protein [Chrysiogenales bacterium]